MDALTIPIILIPKPTVNYATWATIACDQFTSNPTYWKHLEDLVQQAPSTLHLMLPEIYLSEANHRYPRIYEAMKTYVDNQLFDEYNNIIIVQRHFHDGTTRTGFMVTIDLENYDFKPDTTALIVSSEEVVLERLASRIRIREQSMLELPHILVLMKDPSHHIAANYASDLNNDQLVYQVDLSMGGGLLKGYRANDSQALINDLNALVREEKLLAGDGNHSLAAAKKHWDTIKTSLPASNHSTHPSRYALVELVNLYDEGLKMEPIHRVLFDVDSDFLPLIQSLLPHGHDVEVIQGQRHLHFGLKDNTFETIKVIQSSVEHYLKLHPRSRVDYIHNEAEVEEILHREPLSLAILMPRIQRDDLFPYVLTIGMLPKKSFSLGHAEEKRYYMECRKIRG